jgi:uncharacterized phage protein (TIGR01671 family)
MREIKFRAWFHGAGDPRVEPYMKFSHPFPVLFWQAVEEFPIAVEVMQFTGLRDKNGREIFEGDVVFATGNQARYTVIFGSYESFGEVDSDYHCGFYLKRHDTTFIDGLGESEKYLEVIGNVHANPDLLK